MTNESTIAEFERELSGLNLPLHSSFGITRRDGVWRVRIVDERAFVYASTASTLAEAINGAFETFRRAKQ